MGGMLRSWKAHDDRINRIAATSRLEPACIWVFTQKHVAMEHDIKCHSSGLRYKALSMDERNIYCGFYYGGLQAWDIATWEGKASVSCMANENVVDILLTGKGT